ncbi:MAG TPA: zinc-binding dehydrogenase [Actinophytocola sp.]|uniref:zinc-dependent alcohol dehydrogenase n=1 Tax=Actinophytocola sp. TaxID=1872138 RepID=UPI002DBEB16E|nr:zinc-binding dehydrogenase [Actinophytocola sp.]HEU5474335.1 zinc-binding dehydrogenase [Actinophytocola sp.]
MRKFELVDRKEIRLTHEAPVPVPGPGEVLVMVRANTLCNRSDLAYYHYFGLRDHCATGCFGHEVAGVVHQLGAGVTGFSVAERVFVRTPLTSGFADFALARTIALGRLPERIPFEQGAILQLLPLAVHATRGVRLGDRVVIIGQGPVGLMALQVAALRGAAEIVVADLDPWRLARSGQLGADRTEQVDGSLAALHEIGTGFDVAIEAVGTPTTANACVDLVRHNGLVVFLGTHHVDTKVTFDLVTWEKKGLRVHTAAEPTDQARAESMAIAQRLVYTDRIRLAELLTDVYPLEKLPEAIDRLSANRTLAPEGAEVHAGPPPNVLKIAICP